MARRGKSVAKVQVPKEKPPQRLLHRPEAGDKSGVSLLEPKR